MRMYRGMFRSLGRAQRGGPPRRAIAAAGEGPAVPAPAADVLRAAAPRRGPRGEPSPCASLLIASVRPLARHVSRVALAGGRALALGAAPRWLATRAPARGWRAAAAALLAGELRVEPLVAR